MREQDNETSRRLSRRGIRSTGPRLRRHGRAVAVQTASWRPANSDLRESIFADRTFRAALRAGIAVLMLIGVVLFIHVTWVILQPLLVAIVLATAIWPWVTKISSFPIGPRRWRLPRAAATALIYLAVFITAGLMFWIMLTAFVPYLDNLAHSYPEQLGGLHGYLEPFRSGDIATGAARVAEDVARDAASKRNGTNGQTEDEAAGDAAVNIAALALGLLGGMLTLALVLIFTFFLLMEGGRFAQWGLQLIPRERRPQIRSIGLKIRDRTSRWVLAIALYSIISGTIVGVTMWLLQVPNPVLFGVAAALFAAMPGIGPATLAIPAIIMTLPLEPWQPLAIAAFGIAFYAVDATFISPKVFGDMLRLPMFIILIAVLLGTVLLGIWGAIIAAPVAVAVQMIIRELLGHDLERQSA